MTDAGTTNDHHDAETTRDRHDGARVAVIGGGAVGVTTARDLASWGVDVTVYEAGTPGSGASGRAAGVLYDAYADSVDAALGARSMARFRAFDDRVSDGDGFGFHESPYVFCARSGDETRAEAIRRSAERMRAHDRPVETLTGAELADRYPVLQSSDLAVGAVTTNAAVADTGAYTETIARLAREAGVEIHTDTAVQPRTDPVGVERTGVASEEVSESFDAVIVAAGAHTPGLLDRIDAGVAVTPYRVQALTARLDDRRSAGTHNGGPPDRVGYGGPTVYDATSGVYVRPHPTGLLAGDGTVPEPADPDEYDRTADDWFVDDAVTAVRTRLALDPTVERSWAGVCTATPDGDPMLGRLREGIYVAAGWQGHGFMRSPAHAELLAASVAGDLGVTADDRVTVADAAGGQPALDAFDPTRHDPDTTFEIREGMVVESDK